MHAWEETLRKQPRLSCRPTKLDRGTGLRRPPQPPGVVLLARRFAALHSAARAGNLYTGQQENKKLWQVQSKDQAKTKGGGVGQAGGTGMHAAIAGCCAKV